MKVKNIFSNRKSKKKKNAQQTASNEDVTANNSEKLIISSDGNASGKENEQLNVTTNNFTDTVVLRSKTNRGSLKNNDQNELELTKTRASSTSSNTSTKAKSRRPWSFIDQLRRQDSRESAYSTSSSAGTSHQAEDLTCSPSVTPDQETILPRDASSYTRQHRNSGACTLPRSLTPEHFEQVSKTGNSAGGNAYAEHEHHSNKRRTMDFRFFNLFKRSSSGEEGLPPNSGRSSFRGKNKGKKKGGGKKKKSDMKSDQDVRQRTLSDGGETSNTIMYDDETQIPPPGLYDSNTKLNAVDECSESVVEKDDDKRVPVNGEPIFYLSDDITDSTTTSLDSRPCSSSRKYLRRSDPLTGAHSLLKSQTSDSGGIALVRSTSGSTDTSSRRSSYACEPRDSPLPEDTIANFDSSVYLGARVKRLNSSGSVPQISSKMLAVRTLSTDIPKEMKKISVQARHSQSVSNLAAGSNQVAAFIPRSSSDTDKTNQTRRLPKPSPHQKKQEENDALRLNGGSTSAEMLQPPSPVLRVIGYPGVVLRRNKHKQNKQRPNSAYADERTKHVLSLNMEDLPTYTRMRHEMTRSGANIFPSYEDILAVQETIAPTKRGSSGVHYAGTASSRARRRGATISNYGQRSSVGFAVAASAEDLDSLSSSNYGSKQSLSDLSRMDDDERSNALLARSLAITHTSSGNLRAQEPSSKRAKAIRKSVVSLANLISPGKPNQKNSSKLQRSSSFKESGSVVSSSSSTATVASFKPYRPPSNTPNKAKNNRRSKLWCESFDFTGLTEKEIKWQEAIFELYQGERDLVQDLTMAKQTYRDSMVTLKMLSDEEVTLIFGKLGCLLPLHEELLNKLEQARGEDGRTLAIGYIFIEWFPRISTAYREYCANQSDAKYALDAAVERDARVRDFLQRCLESPFSRKLDLWSYLDLPRTRLVKYPLLLQNVLKRTPANMEEERSHLDKVMSIIGEIIERVDETTGEQQCSYIRSKLEYLDDKQRSTFVDNSRLMLCSGQLKNNRGTKMHVFLFEEAFLLTRQTTRSNKISYQVYRSPLPLRSLVVDTNEGDKLSGSFRGGILSSEKVKHSFRVRSEELNITYTLQASEEHDRKQWINAILDALAKYKAKHPESIETPLQSSRRRATYDPTSNNGKKQASRAAVLRSSSDKSNRSVASSTEQSLQEESLGEDSSITSEDVGPWSRTRSQTVNPSILSSKSGSSVSRKSSGSSTKSDKSSKDKESRKDIDTKKLKERLRRLEGEGDGPPSPLRDSFKKKSGISRHFSLSGADKNSKPIVKVRSSSNADEEEKARNKCQRSRSLTSSPMNVKSVGLFGRRRTSNLVVPNAAKPPIGPTASPYSIRRSPSLKASAGIHEAQSTPNLAASVGRSISFSTRRSSSRLAQLTAQNNSNSVGNLRKGLAGSTSDLRGSLTEKRAEEARFLRRARSEDKPASESDKVESVATALPRSNSESTDDSSQPEDVTSDITPSISEFKEPEPISKPMARMAIEIVCTPATPKETHAAQVNETLELCESSDEILTITSTETQEAEMESSSVDPTSVTRSANDVTDSDVMVPDEQTAPEDGSNTEIPNDKTDIMLLGEKTAVEDNSPNDKTETSEQMHCDEPSELVQEGNAVSSDVIATDDVKASFFVDTAGDLASTSDCETTGTKSSEIAVSEKTQSSDDTPDDVMETQSVGDVRDIGDMTGMLVRSTEDLLMEYCDETPPVHTPEGELIQIVCEVREKESEDEVKESEENVCESDVVTKERGEDSLDDNKDSLPKDEQQNDEDVQEMIEDDHIDAGVISSGAEDVAVAREELEESGLATDPCNIQDRDLKEELVNNDEEVAENRPDDIEESNVCSILEEGVDSSTTDEGIVQDGATTSEDTNSDFDNNNVTQVDDVADKSHKDAEADEQTHKHESESATCCRNEISDESINSQHHNIQASV